VRLDPQPSEQFLLGTGASFRVTHCLALPLRTIACHAAHLSLSTAAPLALFEPMNIACNSCGLSGWQARTTPLTTWPGGRDCGHSGMRSVGTPISLSQCTGNQAMRACSERSVPMLTSTIPYNIVEGTFQYTANAISFRAKKADVWKWPDSTVWISGPDLGS
jgi:hypothetical protein